MTTEVEKLLTDKDIRFFSKGKDLLVSCFNPDHEDENPSLRVDREDGRFHCFGCGHKGNVFSLFNRHRNIFNSRVKEVQNIIKDIRKASWAGYEVPQDAFFINEIFRGIPARIINKYRGFTTASIGMEGRVVFPISDNRGVIVGFQGRYKNSDLSPKYLMYPAEVSLPWFPAVNTLQMIKGSIVLTEGLLDALYLHGKGVTNAATIFGTKSVTYDTVLDLLTPYMLAGLQKVYLLMDGDSAGRHAAEHIEKMIKHKTDLLVENIPLEDGVDPATMTDQYINSLIKYLHNG